MDITQVSATIQATSTDTNLDSVVVPSAQTFATGEGPVHVAPVGIGALPGGLQEDTSYFVRNELGTRLSFFRDREDALSGNISRRTDLSSSGSGQFTIMSRIDEEGLYQFLTHGVSTDTMSAANSVDDLIV